MTRFAVRFMKLSCAVALTLFATIAPQSVQGQTYQDEVLADSPTAYYRLGEPLGTNGSGSVINSFGDGESGTPNGGVSFGHPGAVAGDTAAHFDGVNSFIQVLDSNAALDLMDGTAFSIEYWMNPDAHRANDANWHVVSRSNSDDNASDAFIVNSGSAANPAANVRFHTDGWAGGNHRVDSAANTVVLNEWTHVVGTYNGSNEMALYLNGEQVAFEDTINKGPGASAQGDFFIGTLGTVTAGGPDYTGYIDEVAIYNGLALDADRVMAHFSAAGGAGGGPIIKREWRNDASGDWHSGGNWTPTGVPNEVTQTAVFGSVITAPRVVYMETDVTAVKSIEFLNSQTYAVAGTGAINLNSGTSPDNSSIQVLMGSHQFQAAVNLHTNTDVIVVTNASLTFNNTLDLGGNTMTKMGPGELAIRNTLTSGGGTLNLLAGAVTGNGTVGGDLNNQGGTISPGDGASGASLVPEPGSILLLAAGLLCLIFGRRRI